MIKGLIKLSLLTALVVGLILLMQRVGPLSPDTRVMLKYLGLGSLGLAALGMISLTAIALTAIVMGLSFAKGVGGWSARRKERSGRGGAFVADIVGGAIRGAAGAAGEAYSPSSPRKVELSLENYAFPGFRIKTMSGDLILTGHEEPGAKATVEILEKEEGDAEACFEDGEIKLRTKSGRKALIGDATVLLPARLASLSAESVNGDIAISGFLTEAPSFFKGVNGDISVTALKNGSEVGVKTVSGDVEVRDSQFASLLAQSISGDVTVEGSSAENAVIKTVSGDIDCSGSSIRNPTIKTVSGAVSR